MLATKAESAPTGRWKKCFGHSPVPENDARWVWPASRPFVSLDDVLLGVPRQVFPVSCLQSDQVWDSAVQQKDVQRPLSGKSQGWRWKLESRRRNASSGRYGRQGDDLFDTENTRQLSGKLPGLAFVSGQDFK